MTEWKESRKAALKLLEYKGRTEKELREKLAEKGFGEELIEDAVAYAASFGYLDDRRYAQSYILNRQGSKSRRKLQNELRQKGIGEGVFGEAWDALPLEERDERTLIREQLEKKIPPGTKPDEKTLRRTYAYFLRRGFRHEDIMAVLSGFREGF